MDRGRGRRPCEYDCLQARRTSAVERRRSAHRELGNSSLADDFNGGRRPPRVGPWLLVSPRKAIAGSAWPVEFGV